MSKPLDEFVRVREAGFWPALSPEQAKIVACALGVAAEQYERDAVTCETGGDARTAAAFRKQAEDARVVAEGLV